MRRKSSIKDKYGKATFGAKENIQFALVRYDTRSSDTTVRADSSASRGNIRELHTSGRCLVPVAVGPSRGDLIIINGLVFSCMEIEPRYNVLGKLDHYEIDFEKAEDIYGDEI